MGKKSKLLMATFVGLALVAGVASTGAADEFYKGKTIRFIVGFNAGGGFDTYTRAVSRHMGKHIAGNPSTVVENKPGAGSLITANFIYNKAKPDGLTIGHFVGGQTLAQFLGKKSARFEGNKFGWIGSYNPRA